MKKRIDDITITEEFLAHTPKNDKLAECKRYWDEYHLQDRYIVVNHDNVLLDGYCMYLVLKHYGVEECSVKVSNTRSARWNRIVRTFDNQYRGVPTMYVYGYHEEDETRKEYVWRLPSNWNDGDIRIDDRLIVDTRRGETEMVVTKTELLIEPTVQGTVKKVVRRA